jgi:hypothetical protein
MGRKLGATPRFGKAAVHPIIVVLRALRVHLAGPWDRAGRVCFAKPYQASKRPGLSARAFSKYQCRSIRQPACRTSQPRS